MQEPWIKDVVLCLGFGWTYGDLYPGEDPPAWWINRALLYLSVRNQYIERLQRRAAQER